MSNSNMYLSLEERAREHRTKHGPYPSKEAVKVHPEIKGTRCWLWMGTLSPNGYPQMSYKNKTTKLHTTVYKLTYGKIPKGKCVCHKCDVKHCIRPLHFFLGTHLDNMLDRNSKGRQATGIKCLDGNRLGENAHNKKLTKIKVLKIRRLDKSCKYTRKELGEKFGVTPENINRVVRRRTWKHI